MYAVPIVHTIAYFCPFRNGMFTTSQLSNFSLLLYYLSTTQTLFGDNLPLLSLDGCSADGSEDSLNTEGCIVSIFQFHQSFIDYCIRLRLVNLLYHYLDFYRLVQTYFINVTVVRGRQIVGRRQHEGLSQLFTTNILECYEVSLVSNLEGHNQFLLQLLKLLLSVTIRLSGKEEIVVRGCWNYFHVSVTPKWWQKEDKHFMTPFFLY